MPTSTIQPAAPPRRPRNSFLGRSLSDFANQLGIPSPVVESTENPFARAMAEETSNRTSSGGGDNQQQQQPPPFYKAFRRKSSSSSATSGGVEGTTGASSKLALHKISSTDSPPIAQEAVYKTTFSARDSPARLPMSGLAPTGSIASSSYLLDDGPDLPAPIPVVASPGRPLSPRYSGSHSVSSTPPIPEEDWSEQAALTPPPLLSAADFLTSGSPSTWDGASTGELMSPSYFDNQNNGGRRSRPSFSVPGQRESPRWSGASQRTQSPYRVETRQYSALSRSPSRSRNHSPIRIINHSPERRPPSPLKNAINQPFNFKSVDLSASPINNKPSQRKGHRYKHSSVSINFFLEPPVRQPLAIPLSLPIPTLGECIQSMSREQKIRFGCCVCHFLVALQVSFFANSSMSLTVLSHLILYDAMGALLCVSVDVISNFDVWRESSIRHPFGLERVEVLAGLAMSVMLVFMSLDIVSHVVETAFTGALNHHRHGRDAGQHFSSSTTATSKSSNVPVVLACIVTLISAMGLKNHQRIGRALRPHPSSSAVLTNPSHLITLSCCISLLLLPFTPAAELDGVDTIVTLVFSIAMCLVGCRLAIALGGIVMLSNPFSKDIDNIGKEIQSKVLGVNNKKPKIALWQVHHDLFMVNIRIEYKGSTELQSQVRCQTLNIVDEFMSKRCNASTNIKWETTIEIGEAE